MIIEKLKERGYTTVPEKFYTDIENWRSWYKGSVAEFHNYYVFNGQKQVVCRRYTMGMGKKVAEDWANLLMNEKVKITLEGTNEQAFFDDVCLSNNFLVKMSEMQEMKAALGTTAYVPRVVGAAVDPVTGALAGNAEEIRLDYVTAENIYPLSWENGRVIECAFASTRVLDNQRYLYLQIHKLEPDKTYAIENVLYKETNGGLTEVDPATVPEYARVPRVVRTGSPKRQFVIDRLNIANNVDVTLPMGISVFANAIDQLKGLDIAYDSYVNEFSLGKKRIMVKPEAMKGIDGEPIFDPNDTVFYVMPQDLQDGTIISPIDMKLRTSEHNAGLQDMLNTLSVKCGFGENHYKFYNGTILTATQVISENSTLFRTIKKHEIILEDALIELCRIILRLGNTFFDVRLNEDVEISIDFDDSIIESKQEEFNRVLQLLSAGLMRAEEARSILMNEDIKTARRALPGIRELATEEQNEVE